MQMRPQIQIRSILKALADVVLPAVDPANKLAQEQAKLVMGLLTLMAQQEPVMYRFDLDELSRLLALSETLQSQAKGGEGTRTALDELAESTRTAAQILEQAKVSPDRLQQSVRDLKAATGSVVTQVFRDGDAACRTGVQAAVLAMSREQLLRDRALLLMQGWEPDPKALPPLESLLGSTLN